MTDSELQQKRLIAAAIDIAVAVAISFLFVVMVWGLSLVVARTSFVAMGYAGRVLSFVGALLGLAYVLGRDVVAGGNSIGKKTQGLKVVTTSGAPGSLADSAKRNLFFAIGSLLGVLSATLGLLPCLGDVVNCLLAPLHILGSMVAIVVAVIEVVKIIQDPEGVRLGDGFAGTRVVRG